jgi:predicted dienelactone hydrolase
MHVAATAFFVLTGCAYRAGSFDSMNQDFVGTRASAGCLDLAIERRADIDRGPVVAYSFGNRCDAPALVDLADAVVVARTSDDAIQRLTPYDPRQEIVAREIDARAVGGEAIAYVSSARLPELCVDTASIAHVPGHSWLCFADMEAE